MHLAADIRRTRALPLPSLPSYYPHSDTTDVEAAPAAITRKSSRGTAKVARPAGTHTAPTYPRTGFSKTRDESPMLASLDAGS
jgi:hypothetical protein